MNTPPLWLSAKSTDPNLRARIFCFPFAGGGALAFRKWIGALGPEIDLCPVQLPGRENRIGEPGETDSQRLTRTLAAALSPHLDRPFIFFGHSMGAKLAYTVARELIDRFGTAPLGLIASGSRAPHLKRQAPLLELPEAEFVEAILTFEGTPKAVFDHPDLRAIYLPLLMADFRLDADLYRPIETAPLPCPIHAFCGSDDPEAEPEEVMSWAHYTTAAFSFTRFSGGHFFIQNQERTVLERIQVLSEELLCEPPHPQIERAAG